MNNYLKPYTKYNSYYDFIASKTKGEPFTIFYILSEIFSIFLKAL